MITFLFSLENPYNFFFQKIYNAGGFKLIINDKLKTA